MTIFYVGYLQAVKNEVNLLQQMVKTLDAFSGQQSRHIVVNFLKLNTNDYSLITKNNKCRK